MKKWHKSLFIGVGAIVLSTVAIQASDLFRGIEGNLAGLAIEGQGPCAFGSTLVLLGSHSMCVDTFEASAGESCPHITVVNQLQTQENANEADCATASLKNTQPWSYVSLTQAQQLCARTGKRLPTNNEWYKIISGFYDVGGCIIKSNDTMAAKTGSGECKTPSGIYDMVGNVWEWIDEQAHDGKYQDRQLPPSGYVSLVDIDGIVIETKKEAVADFGNDYAVTNVQGVFGVIRGGFYGSGEDAGIFAQNLAVPLDFKSVGVGFRCVKDLQ